MTKKLTEENKAKKFEEYRDVLKIIHYYGDGMMLRQQLVILAAMLPNHNKIKVEVKLSEMERHGFIKGIKAFANSKHKMILLSKYSLSRFNGLISRDVNITSTATSNKLYSIYKVQLCILFLQRKHEFGGIAIKKSNPLKVYSQYNSQNEVTEYCKQDYFAIKNGKNSNKNIGRTKSDNGFDFRRLLQNNFLFRNTIDGTITIYYLKINGDSSARNFLDLIKKVVYMFRSYSEAESIKIKVIILFFNDKELDYFQKALSKKTLDKYYKKNNIMYFHDTVSFKFFNLELDKNYNLARELS